MTKFKKIVAAVLAVAIGMGISVSSIADSGVSTYSDYLNIDETYSWLYNNLSYPNLNDADKQKIIEEYLESSEFILQYRHNRKASLDTIVTRLEIDNRIDKEQQTRGVYNTGSLFSCSVNTNIVQEKTTWCGVASTLMVLTGVSSHSSYSLVSNYSEPSQIQISREVIPQGQTTAFVYAICNYLNSQLSPNASNHYTYTFVEDSMTVTQLTNYIKYSLAADRPVILRAAPYGILSYYNGSGISSSNLHYIVVDGYDRSSDTFWVADCTYLPAYQGRHYYVAASEIRDCVEGNYIIHA